MNLGKNNACSIKCAEGEFTTVEGQFLKMLSFHREQTSHTYEATSLSEQTHYSTILLYHLPLISLGIDLKVDDWLNASSLHSV